MQASLTSFWRRRQNLNSLLGSANSIPVYFGNLLVSQLTCGCELRTPAGNVRPHNEDAAIAMDSSGLWLVADGMVGHQAGDYASKAIVSSLSSLNPSACLADVVEQAEDALTAVNKQLISYAHVTYGGLGKVGSTVACLVIRDGVSVAIWSGDSRICL